jgi:hypothetical protein
MGLLGGEIKAMVYNRYGDQIAEVSEHEAREYGINDNGQLSDAPIKESVNRSEARFRYDYDANGNWVLKTVEARATKEQEFTESGVERRTIEYFGSNSLRIFPVQIVRMPPRHAAEGFARTRIQSLQRKNR